MRIIGQFAYPDNVFICLKSDLTQISVSEIRDIRPLRKAAVISRLAYHYKAMENRGHPERLFWVNIDDEAAKLMCPLTFPTKEELQVMRTGALWLARRLPQYFDVNEAEGYVYLRNDDLTIIHNLRNESLIPNTTLFAFSVQQEIKGAIVDRQELTTQAIRDMYQAELASIPAEDYTRRDAFRRVIDEFIEKTLLRIDQEYPSEIFLLI